MCRHLGLAPCLALLLGGCSTLLAPPYAMHAVAPQDAGCLQAFERLDAAVVRAGVRDAENERIAGFPSLRVDRLGAALLPVAASDDAAFDAWLERSRRLDLEARHVEAAQLAPPAEPPVTCSQRLTAAVRADAAARPALIERARVPDRYSSAARVAGLYALTRLPFFAGVERWQARHETAMRDAAAQARPALRLAPDVAQAPPTLPVRAWPRDALGLPRLDDQAAERLLAAHAPLFDIETQGPFDAVGTPAWGDDGRLVIDTTRPVVYQRIAHTLVRGRALLQLVYTLWFPERPKQGPLDLLGGAFDGVVVRLTLAPDGRALMLDTIHACGCYHLFFPARGVSPKPGAPANEEWAFAPAALPEVAAGERLLVRIASASHYVLGVSAAHHANDSAALRYTLRPEDELRRLPLPGGGTRSLYGPDALIAGSERAERFLFWPMGIVSAGAMRQWGHHATAFVGRRHFDDADLIERRFELPPLD